MRKPRLNSFDWIAEVTIEDARQRIRAVCKATVDS